MKKGRIFNQMLDIIIKILIAFIIVFVLYLISKFVNNFAYDYFAFPLISMVIMFLCGVNVGKSLEKVKNKQCIGFFTKIKNDNHINEKTEFYINDKIQIITNKKILKEVQEGDKVHIKTFNYNEINIEKKDDEQESVN